MIEWWRDRYQRPQSDRHDIRRVFSAIELDVSASPQEPRRRDNEEPLPGRMRELLGDKAFESLQRRLVKQRDGFKTGLANAIDGGSSGREMAEFLNGHAFLWKYLYVDAERDSQFMTMIERALTLCGHNVPEHWYRAVKDVDANRELAT